MSAAASHSHSKAESEHRPSLQIKVPKYAPRGISGSDFLAFFDSSSSSATSAAAAAASSSSSAASKSSQLIVDVRDSDSAGGHLKGAKNVPHDHFESEVDAFVKQVSSSGTATRVIFICQYGKERSPAAAAAFLSHWQSQIEEGKEPPEVCYVKGGFTGILSEAVSFSATGAISLTGKFAGLFEAFDSSAWIGVKDPTNIKPFVAISKKDVDSAYVLLKK